MTATPDRAPLGTVGTFPVYAIETDGQLTGFTVVCPMCPKEDVHQGEGANLSVLWDWVEAEIIRHGEEAAQFFHHLTREDLDLPEQRGGLNIVDRNPDDQT